MKWKNTGSHFDAQTRSLVLF